MKKSLSISPSDPAFTKIGEASKILGVSIDTLRRWEKAGKIKAVRTPGGTRLYSLDSFKPPPSSTEELLKKAEENVILRGSARSANGSLNDSQDKPERPLPKPETIPETTRINVPIFSKIYAEIYAHPKIFLPLLSTIIITGVAGAAYLNASLHPASNLQLQTSNPNVLAALAGPRFLEINSDSQINGALAVRDTINNLIIEASPSASTFSLTSGNTTFTITDSGTIDQDVSTTSSPTFSAITLSSSTNQISSGGFQFT